VNGQARWDGSAGHTVAAAARTRATPPGAAHLLSPCSSTAADYLAVYARLPFLLSSCWRVCASIVNIGIVTGDIRPYAMFGRFWCGDHSSPACHPTFRLLDTHAERRCRRCCICARLHPFYLRRCADVGGGFSCRAGRQRATRALRTGRSSTVLEYACIHA